MRLVILESPYAGNIERNIVYAREALLDSLRRGEAPLASHLLYPQVLSDAVTDDRMLGIQAGLAWGLMADATVVYVDHGISYGMQMGIEHAQKEGRPIEHRRLYPTELP